ncbi:probable disease resistance protein At4g27220 [Salvia hispanica]|uniref:probable disease resistance protein At4g27220 n=1 Tax=Salvia hispanica TaxID=49212 RepID=UPI0020090C92|nr:probable disease resistance protein At4g27220 [Salvia hispanica]
MEGGVPAKLNVEVDTLVEQRLSFCELVLDVCGSRGDKLLTNGMVGEAFNENLEMILKLLESGQVSSIGVYGMGGVGKTTLAKHIHNRLLQHSQGRVIWVTVSQEFSVTTLQDKIASIIDVDLVERTAHNEDIRAARLHTTLSHMKNTVLILDDVWENIDLSMVGCPISVECCRLIITSRSLQVCRQICCQQVFQVKTLHHQEAWELFKETLRNEIELDSSVEEIARSAAKLCGGLPLAIVTVAGSMRGERAIHTWRNAYAELKERVTGKDGMGDGDVYNVLKYSFDRLNRNHHNQTNEFNTLQHCFLHCALHPEDEKIMRVHLVSEFISGGLLDERKTRRDQVEQVHSILDKLVNVCLLESSVDPEWVKMHDLVRGMALKICEVKYMVRAGDKSSKEIPRESEWTKDLEKVSLMRSSIMRIQEGMSPDCPKLSTLLLQENFCLNFIPDSFFSKMQGLCTLDLRCTMITMLPNSVCAMKSLKALLLNSCQSLKYVPYLGEMKELKELNLSHTAIKEVPQGVGKLFNLKFLAMNAPRLNMLPRGLFLKLGNLQHLELPFHMKAEVEEIENLKLLEEFSGRVENVKDLKSLITSWGNRVRDTSYTIGVGSYDGDFHTRIGACYNKELFLFKCNLEDERVLAEGIVQQCEGLGNCFVDGLKRLRIKSCGETEYIWRSEAGLSSQMSTLEEIELIELDAMKGLIEKGEIGASAALAQPVFSSLTRLVIYWCNKMRIPVPVAPNLEDIHISYCYEIEEIFDEGTSSLTLPKLKRIRLQELPKLRKVGILSRAPNLEDIGIRECEEIEEIFETSSLTLPKLKDVWLKKLPRLRKLGILSRAPNLEVIDIRKCGEIEEIFEDEGTGSLTLPKLKKLKLKVLPRLRKVGILSRAPNLEDIGIWECEKVEELFETSSLTLPKLKTLLLKELPRLRKVGIVSRAPNLEHIDISECEKIEEIFETSSLTLSKLTGICLEKMPRLRKVGKLSSAPNLEHIDISECEEIEEIFETSSLTLSKLTGIRLEELPRLRKVGILSRAPNLEHIDIRECEEIEEIFEDEERHCLALPKLKEVWLYNLPGLRKVGIPPSGVPNLITVSVSECGGLEDVFDDEERGCITLPKLIRLHLEQLPTLKSLCKGTTIICNSIQSIYINECPRLTNKLPVVVDLAVPRRYQIRVNPELWESLKSDDPNLSLFFKSYKYLI